MWQTHVSSAALKLVSPATRTDRNATRRDKSHTLRMRQPESSRRQKRLDVLHIDRCPKEAVVTLLFVFLPKQLTCGQPQYSVTRRKKSRTVIRDQEMSRFSAMMIFLTASVLLVLVPTSRGMLRSFFLRSNSVLDLNVSPCTEVEENVIITHCYCIFSHRRSKGHCLLCWSTANNFCCADLDCVHCIGLFPCFCIH